MPLEISVGQSSQTGPRDRNEDYCGIVTPDDSQLTTKGAILAVADGVGGGNGGREASEFAVRGVLSDYYATPDTWEIPFALDKLLVAINRWLLAQGASHRELAGMACTLSMLVLRGNRFYTAHIGDSRVYRLRGQQLERLTTDHVWDRPDMSHVLKRAIGLDQHLVMDYADGELQEGDCYLLVSDGVWEPLGDKVIHELLHLHQDPQRAADQLVNEALTKGGHDNATALVVRVNKLPDENLLDLLAEGRDLPVPPRLKPGQQIDEFEVLEVIHDSRATLLYKVKHSVSNQILVLKTLQPILKDDPESCNGLISEEWLAKRVLAHYFPQIIPLSSENRHYLYYVMTFHEGATLQQKIDSGQHFSIADTSQIGIRLMKGLSALHRLNIIHRDIKPDNLHSGEDGKLRILDLGVALNPSMISEKVEGNAGTPSYMAPELFVGEPATVQTDIYAAGVSLYYLLTRKYPYGEIEPFQHPRFGEPVPPTRYRPDIPQWLENILLKAVAKDINQRFETTDEFLIALERGEFNPLLAPQRTPLAGRNPMRTWQAVATVSIVINLLLLYLMVVS
ncbi:bifunctional protein-serine/threonine kinase/phosphatase [Sulfurirhabdus autotrophica]|uniref:Protein phosphatase n=1 Tax=Sulfurirhabdus autotrophica TaxID=1706046 RepID=A0A4V2W0W1_9PROT|nr:bifunctional protein-serine/threonine kinase/phosphatase [Sulfurirhabdus autotrophica]TCV81055.1 protein phosphatase [Sulfurirhabdus autotrophica]